VRSPAVSPDERVAARAPVRARVVRRTGLSDRLTAATPGGVALVCAPAGSGKTMVLRSWLETCGEEAAWVSVERGEHDPQRFWLAVVDAVGRAVGEDGPVERVAASPGFAGDAVVARLLAGLRSLDRGIVLVIDDLHELKAPQALDLLEAFVAQLPPTVRLVLASREDPRLGLHRLRVGGTLTELRGPELSFSAEEARQLLETSSARVSPESLTLLLERTEGWAAGLRLAALSMAGHPEPDRFVREFSGSERTVAAYLMAEVLERQPPEVSELLLRTSLLERVNGPLADHMTGATGSEAILQSLADANAFVMPLDAGRSWFRYHHLFADLLRLELRRLAPGTIGALHRAAAEWHEQHGDVLDAIRHAQEASDWPYAGRLLADNHARLVLDARAPAVRELLDGFPGDAPATDPELALAAATARVPDAALEDAVAYLAVAERLAGDVAPDRRPRFELELAVVKLALARRRGDLPTVRDTMVAVQTALREQPPGGPVLATDLRASALMDLGIAEAWSARLEDARRDLEDARALARRVERPYLEVACLAHLALASLLGGGRMPAALELAEESASIAEENGWSEDPVVATACAVSACGLVMQGRFGEAEPYLDRSERTVRPQGEPATELIVHHVRGLSRLAQGRLDEALAAFQRAERVRARLVDVERLSVEPQRGAALAHARRGDTAAARAALAAIFTHDRGRLEARAVDAAIAVADGEPERAVEVLAPVTGDRPEEPVRWAMLEALVVLAVARDRLGDRRGAETALEQALDHAESDGIVLPFLLMPVQDLLERHPRHRTAHATLLAEILDVLAGNAPAPRGAAAEPADELSAAELRVVGYLPTNLKTSEIAAELFVSSNTVRTHVTHIYRKLGAHSRSEAVARARELGLLAPSSRRR
jgi:LuxR family maltose regulon positive regulatory protein